VTAWWVFNIFTGLSGPTTGGPIYYRIKTRRSLDR
jgi:hypothetical protein